MLKQWYWPGIHYTAYRNDGNEKLHDKLNINKALEASKKIL